MTEPRIFKRRKTENASMFYGYLPPIDMKRAIAVYIRQSKTGADNKNGESRETQLGLIDYVAQLRSTSSDDKFIRLYDEGAGKSGQKRIDERPQLNRLYSDLRRGEIGTIVVAREDRLFRDKHGHQVGLFTELAERMNTVVIVPPIVSSETHLYDFTNYEHLKDFQDKMKAAYDYIHYHNGYIQATKRKKASRGEFDGRSLPPGLVVRFKEVGIAQKPLIYEPWAEKIRQLAARAKELDWSIAQLNREVAQLPYLFPEPSAEDKSKYIFSTTLTHKQTPQGNGYTPHHQTTIKAWLTNVALIGWWVVDGETDDVIEENHPAILDRALFEEGYMKLTGYTLEGDPVEQTNTGVKRIRETYTEVPDVLFHGRITVPPPDANRTAFSCVDHTNSALYYEGHSRRTTGMIADKLFSIPCRQFDELVIARLKELAGTDKNIREKIELGLKQIQEKQAASFVSIDDQLESLRRQIRICEKKLIALEAEDLEDSNDSEADSEDSEDREDKEDEEDVVTQLVKQRKSLRRQRAELIAKKKKLNVIDSPEEVRQFQDQILQGINI